MRNYDVNYRTGEAVQKVLVYRKKVQPVLEPEGMKYQEIDLPKPHVLEDKETGERYFHEDLVHMLAEQLLEMLDKHNEDQGFVECASFGALRYYREVNTL